MASHQAIRQSRSTGRRTKIVCTIGPATSSTAMIEELIRAGMNVARLNLSHGTLSEHAQSVRTLRNLSQSPGIETAVLIDLPGPKYRTGKLKAEIHSLFGRSLSIRELDSGSDNSTEIEMVNLTTPYYDIERFGVSTFASPADTDVLAVTGSVTHNMELAVRKTYDAMPFPKLVIAVGDDACDGGIFKGTYAVCGGVDTVIPVDLKIPGNPPSPKQILTALLCLMSGLGNRRWESKRQPRTLGTPSESDIRV